MVVAHVMRSAVLLAFSAAVCGAAFANPLPRDQRLSDEQEMLAKAREEGSEARRGPVKRLQGTVAPADKAGVTAVDPTPGMEAAQREAELQRLSDKLRRAHSGRTPRQAAPIETPWSTEVTRAFPDATEKPAFRPEIRSGLGHHAAASTIDAGEPRATVLLVMTPGNKGIRRFEKTADPILCSNDGCYISNGPDTAARFISLRRSFGALNTFGPRAGACRQSTGCAFRGVDVSATNTILQPVDLKLMVHDRRAIKPALIDDTCTVDSGRLACSRPIEGDDFVMWVVPESVASRAGTAALSLALQQGLPATRRAALR